MEKDLIKFMKNIKYINKDISEYEDEKGNYYIIPNGQLIVNTTFNQLTEEEYKIGKFQNIIEDLDYEETTIKKAVSKDKITKKEKDKYTVIDVDTKVKNVWVVTNQLKASKCFTTKKDALKLAKKINMEILKQAEV
jgi:hypothetical protein